MKLTQFTPEVNKNLLNGKVQAVDSPAAYGGNQSGVASLNTALGTGIEAYKKQWMKDQNDRIIDATNDYMQRVNSMMDDEKDGLFVNYQGKNAESLQQAYSKGEEDIYNQVMKAHGINSDYAVTAFNQKRMSMQTSALDTIDKYQKQQLDIYSTNQAQTLLDNTIDSIIRNPGNMRESMNTFMPLLKANMAGRGWDESTIQVKSKQAIDSIAEKVLTSMSTTNDYNSGLDAVSYFRTLQADEATMKKFEALFTATKTESTTKKSFSDDLTSDKVNCTNTSFEDYYEKWSTSHPLNVSHSTTDLGRIGDKIGSELGWDPSWGYAVADFESAGGEAAPGNNYFGIKWDGEGDYQELNTRELDENGNEYYTKDKFKVYATPEDAAMSYVNWIKNNCSEEEIKSVHSPADVAKLMKAHGYYTDNEETYAAGLEARAKNYAGQATISDDEKEKLEEDREKAAKVEWMKRKEQQQESINQTISDMNVKMAEMSTPYERESYINQIAAGNPLFASSTQYKSMIANVKAQERAEEARAASGYGGSRAGGTGYAKNKMVTNLIGLIGSSIVSREELDQKMELAADNGYAFTDEQKAMVESAWDRYQHGDKEFSVELPTAKELADYTGVDSSQFDASTMGLIRQRIYQYSNNQYEMIPNPNGYPATPDVIKRIAQEVVQNNNIYHEDHWFSADEDYNVSMAGLARAGITGYTPYGNGMFQVEGRNGESFWCSAQQLQDMNNGAKTMLDVMEENQQGEE